MGVATTLTPNLNHTYYSKFGAVRGCAVWGVNGQNMCTMDTALRGANAEGMWARDFLHIENLCSVAQKKIFIQEHTPRSQSLNYSIQHWIILDEHQASLFPFPMLKWERMERMEWKAWDIALSMLLLACYENCIWKLAKDIYNAKGQNKTISGQNKNTKQYYNTTQNKNKSVNNILTKNAFCQSA